MDEYPAIEAESTDLIGCSYFALKGALEHGCLELLADRITSSTLGRSTRFFIIDMSGVPYIEGDGGLIGLASIARDRQGAVLLVGMTEPVREVFQMTELTQVFRCFGCDSDAMDFVREWIAKRRPPDQGP